jgi:hypothetical protein
MLLSMYCITVYFVNSKLSCDSRKFCSNKSLLANVQLFSIGSNTFEILEYTTEKMASAASGAPNSQDPFTWEANGAVQKCLEGVTESYRSSVSICVNTFNPVETINLILPSVFA